MATPFKSKGTLLELNTTGSTWVAIPARISVSGPSQKVNTIEVTTLDDTHRKYIPGVIEGQEVTAECLHDPSDAAITAMEALIDAPANKNFRVTFSDTGAAVYAFEGILTGSELSAASIDDPVKITFTIQQSGAVTKTA